MADLASSYISFPLLLSSSFSSSAYASSAVKRTTDPSDQPPIDLSPALARVLFDIQELDSRIDSLTRRAGAAALDAAERQDKAAGEAVGQLETAVAKVAKVYDALDGAVIRPAEKAEAVVMAAERVTDTVSLVRAVSRVLSIARALQGLSDDARRAKNDVVGPSALDSILNAAVVAFSTLTAVTKEDKRVLQVVAVRSAQRAVIQPAIRALVVAAQERVQAGLASVSGAEIAAVGPALTALGVLTADIAPGRAADLVRAGVDGHVDESTAAIVHGMLRHPGLVNQLFSSDGGSTDALIRTVGLVLPDRLLNMLSSRTAAIAAIDNLVRAIDSPDPNSTPAAVPGGAILDRIGVTSVSSYFFVALSQKLTRSFSPASKEGTAAFGQSAAAVFNNFLPLSVSGLGLASLRSAAAGAGITLPTGSAGQQPSSGLGSGLSGAAAAEMLRPLARRELERIVQGSIVAGRGDGDETRAATALLVQALALGLVGVLEDRRR